MTHPDLNKLPALVPLVESPAGTAPSALLSFFTKTCSHITDNQTTAFSVSVIPHFTAVPINTVIDSFKIPDFHAALGDFFTLGQSYSTWHGHRKSRQDCALPFRYYHIWNLFLMQQHSAQDSHLTPPHTVQALPLALGLPFGCGSTVMIKRKDNSGM